MALLITILLMVGTNMAWLYVWNQYDFSSESYTVENDGNSNLLGAGASMNGVTNGIESGVQEEDSNRGYSRRMSYADGRSYADGSYAYPEEDFVRPDGSYSRRGRSRDAMGRYSGDGSVDEHTKQELMKLIEKM